MMLNDKLACVSILHIVTLTTATGSHVYASISEVRELYQRHNFSTFSALEDPIQCFQAIKELFGQNIVDKIDLLGALAGLSKIRNHLNGFEALEQCDIDLLEVVENFTEEMELEQKTAIDFDLGKLFTKQKSPFIYLLIFRRYLWRI